MLYVDSRPVTRFTKPGLRRRFYQFRQFVEGDVIKAIRKVGEPVRKVERMEEVFIVPGRDEHVVKIIDGERFAMRTLLDRKKGIEHWEVDAQESLPIRRGLSAIIGARVPRLRTALMTFIEPAKLSTAMAKRTKRFESDTKIEEMRVGEVKLYLCAHAIDGELSHSVVLRADTPESIREVMESLPLSPEQSANLNAYLTQ